MSELSARLGLYVGIDQIVLEDRDRLQAAAAVIPVYGLDLGTTDDSRPTTVGWHVGVQELLHLESVPTIETNLAEFQELREPSALDQARRLRAAWAVAQVIPETDPDLLAEMLAPVVREGLAERKGAREIPGELLVREALALVEFLSVPDGPAARGRVGEVIQFCLERRWTSQRVAVLAMVSCEDSTDLKQIGADVDQVAHIITRVPDFDVGTRTLDQVLDAVQPLEWPDCLKGFWCDMRKITRPAGMPSPPPDYYREVVGNCPTKWFEPYLAVEVRDLVDIDDNVHGFDLQYALASETALTALSARRRTALAQDDRVGFDSGSIIFKNFRTVGGTNRVDITTSKSIGLRELPTGGVALFACVTGWADHTRMMMSGCLGL